MESTRLQGVRDEYETGLRKISRVEGQTTVSSLPPPPLPLSQVAEILPPYSIGSESRGEIDSQSNEWIEEGFDEVNEGETELWRGRSMINGERDQRSDREWKVRDNNDVIIRG